MNAVDPHAGLSGVVGGKLEAVYYCHLLPGADLFLELKRICAEHDIRTGIVMSITGGLEKARFQVLTTETHPMGTPVIIEVPGPFEASGHGLIGHIKAKALGGIYTGEEEGSAYLHVHVTVTRGDDMNARTICGHLMPGCTVRAMHPTSHFVMVVGKVAGVELTLESTADAPGGYAESAAFNRVVAVPH